jgi:FtsP/CotA-like multicopper oxidase with cupredoxin domain
MSPNWHRNLGFGSVLDGRRRVEITVLNQLHEPTTVHWHGMELVSYYDGVADWGAHGKQSTPMIDPGASFRVRFTPRAPVRSCITPTYTTGHSFSAGYTDHS